MKRTGSVFAFLALSLPALAQEQVEMADTMRSEGKIYVVVAIGLIILAGLLAYVFVIDRKASRMEKKLDDLLKK